MRSLARLGIVLLITGLLSSARTAQEVRKQLPLKRLDALTQIQRPDVTAFVMKATLAYTELGKVAENPRDRIKLEITFKNIGDAELPNLVVDVSFFRDGHHLDTWSFSKLSPGESKQWWDYYEFKHGDKVTFTVQIHPGPGQASVESERGMCNNRREIVIDEAEDTILHAGGEICGHFTKSQ